MGIAGLGQGFFNYLGMSEQADAIKANNAAQERMFGQNLAQERYMFDISTGLAKNKMAMDRQSQENQFYLGQRAANLAEKNAKTNETVATNQYNLGLRAADTADKLANAQILTSKANLENSERDRVLNNKLLQLNNFTKFFNSPEGRLAFAKIWA